METQTADPPRVLVVDDQRDTTAIIGLWLAKKGYCIQAVNDSRQALQAARDFHPDVVILDITMPYMDGYEVARQVRGEPALAQVPIVACTALQSGHHFVQARSAGFTHHLTKPCDLQEIESLVNGLTLQR